MPAAPAANAYINTVVIAIEVCLLRLFSLSVNYLVMIRSSWLKSSQPDRGACGLAGYRFPHRTGDPIQANHGIQRDRLLACAG